MRGRVIRRSVKTTAAGLSAIATGLSVILGAVATENYEAAVGAVPGLVAGIVGLFARDNNVSSQDVGIR